MNTPRMVAALRAGEPEAMAALFDAHAADLYRYSWFLLRSREAAQVAVRDAMVVAAAHAAALPDPGQLRQWLYTLARAECARRRPVPAASADEPPARPTQPDADGRVLAWNAVTSLDIASAEILELTTRHGMPVDDAAMVVGRDSGDAAELLRSARNELAEFVCAYVVTRRVGFDCRGLTSAIQGWAGVLTAAVRDRVLAHAQSCADCRRHLPQNVSPERVYDLLPRPDPHEAMRGEVLSWFADPRHGGYRNFAAARAAGAARAAAAAMGDTLVLPAFGHEADPQRTRRRIPRPGGRMVAGLAAAAAAALGAAVFAFAGLPGSSPSATPRNPPAAAVPSGPRATGPLTRPGAVAAVRVGDHRAAARDPFASPAGEPVQALFLAVRHRAGTSAHGGKPRRKHKSSGWPPTPGKTPTPVPTWQRGPSPTPTPPPSPTQTPTQVPSSTQSSTTSPTASPAPSAS